MLFIVLILDIYNLAWNFFRWLSAIKKPSDITVAPLGNRDSYQKLTFIERFGSVY